MRGFRREAVEAMLRYPWEGNVRELQYAVERAVILCQGPYLGLSDLEIRVPLAGSGVPLGSSLKPRSSFMSSRPWKQAGEMYSGLPGASG